MITYSALALANRTLQAFEAETENLLVAAKSRNLLAKLRQNRYEASLDLPLNSVQNTDIDSLFEVVSFEWGCASSAVLRRALDWHEKCRNGTLSDTLEPVEIRPIELFVAQAMFKPELLEKTLNLGQIPANEDSDFRLLAHLLFPLTEDLMGLTRETVNRSFGPLETSALCYLCNSKILPNNTELKERRLGLATKLLELGADPNAQLREAETVRGCRTSIGGAIGCIQSTQVLELLLKRGASIEDGPTLYEGSAMWYAVGQQNSRALGALIDHDPPLWHLCHALTHALSEQAWKLVGRLLDAGADPNWSQTVNGFEGNALHEAIWNDAPAEVVQSLIDKGARLDFLDRANRTPQDVATALARENVRSLFKAGKAGRTSIQVGKISAGQIGAESMSRSGPLAFEENLYLHHALSLQSIEVAEKLLEYGCNPLSIDYRGNNALHKALQNGAYAFAADLLDSSPELAAQMNFKNETALDIAISQAGDGDPYLHLLTKFDQLVSRNPDVAISPGLSHQTADAFEATATSICTGDIDACQKSISAHPPLTKLRSRRPHHCTLLNYVGVNGIEGERMVTPQNIVEVIDLLRESGCDVNATAGTYRGGPGQTTLGLLTSSDIPPADLMLPMIEALMSGEATEEELLWHYTLQLYKAFRESGAAALKQVATDIHRNTEALAYLLQFQQKELVQLMLSVELDTSFQDTEGVTPLHRAAFAGYEEVVSTLIDLGFNPNIRDKQFDGTAIGWAHAGGYAELGPIIERKYQETQGKDSG